MDDTDEEAAVAMVAAAVDEVQAAAEPVVVGPDTSNLERAGRAINNNHTTPAKEFAMDDKDEEVAVAMVASTVDEIQAVSKPVVVGLDTSNPEQTGRATNNKEGKQSRTHT